MTKDEALDKALEAAYLAGFNASGEGYNGEYPFRDHGAHPEQDAGWIKNRDSELNAIKQARSAPVQSLPFGVGGGLVAIKTLLSRDPCVHANTAIEMIDAILKEHPAAQRQWVGLTVDELITLEQKHRRHEDLSRAIEANLKEKNGM
jgi:hypothetical protein